MYKIIFFDLDGTLLNDEKEVLEESKKAIQKAKDSGIEVVLCSGRQRSIVEPYVNDVGGVKYIISSNGASLYDYENKETLFACETDSNLSLNLYKMAIERNFLGRVDTLYGRYMTDLTYKWLNEVELIDGLEEFFAKNKILQLSVGAPLEEIDKIIDSLKDKPYVKIENKYIAEFTDNMWIINVINSSASKGNAISGLCKYLKIDLKDAIAFGDDLNDVSMMKTVGLGVAMGNAHPAVKECAKKVIGNNNEPSIAKFIDEILENNKN